MLIRWTVPALHQLEQTQDYLAQHDTVIARRVTGEIVGRTHEILSQAPKAGRVGRIGGTRELVLAPLPYIVVYRLREEVEIVALMHGAQRWPRRL